METHLRRVGGSVMFAGSVVDLSIRLLELLAESHVK